MERWPCERAARAHWQAIKSNRTLGEAGAGALLVALATQHCAFYPEAHRGTTHPP